MHPLQRAVESPTFHVSRAVARQHSDNPGIAVVIPTVLKHPQLQPLVGGSLLSPVPGAAVKQVDFHAAVLHAVPELLHFRRNGAGGDSFRQRAVRVRKSQQVVEMDANQVTSTRSGVFFLGNTLCLVKYDWSYPNR